MREGALLKVTMPRITIVPPGDMIHSTTTCGFSIEVYILVWCRIYLNDSRIELYTKSSNVKLKISRIFSCTRKGAWKSLGISDWALKLFNSLGDPKSRC